MLKSLQRPTSILTILWFVFFYASAILVSHAQTGRYDLRFVQESYDCVARKVVFSAQIRAAHPDSTFIMGSSSLPFTFPAGVLSTPVLSSIQNFSGGRYTTLTMTQQSSVLTLNIVYQGMAPFEDPDNVLTDWKSIAQITFDVPSGSDGCYSLVWNDENAFPSADVNEVVISGGSANEGLAQSGTFEVNTACAFAAGLPVASIMGDTSIFLGEQAVLKVNFTGELPQTISVDGISYSNLSQSPVMINVFPDQTTTYTIDSVSNACGKGTVSGSATVTILSPGITTQNLTNPTVCPGVATSVGFTSTTAFAAGNIFTVQLSDASGSNFVNIPTTGTTSPLTATIPANTPAGSGYRVRVVASNPATIGDPSGPFSVSAAPTATLSGTTTINAGGTANLSVALTGQAPWNVVLSNTVNYTSNVSPLLIPVTPAATTTYSLVSVSDNCTAGTVSGSATVTVLPIGVPCNTLCVPVSIVIIK
ncbi:hypothetical protein [Arundinibacter roseus]|uniref:Uncharacterized protein n=1 Tax=Arundinibacter roseus TaxID=2070510 RepID=A0A4V2X869_9BACT|nr:hypothetical protein [Arundinibacter roseus]TDB58665.1 hypothetical protein EZE20_22865 [Arundinibacter roseus]